MRRRLQAADLFNLRLISEAQISPDGTRICFAQTVLVPEANRYRSQLWVVPVAGGEPQPFTEGNHLDFAPAWSPDGSHIAFLSTRSGSRQVWIIAANGGEARKVTAVRGIAGRPVWAPDGRRIVCTIRVDEQGLQPEQEEAAEPSPQERFTRDVRRVTTLPFKLNDAGFIGDKFAQLAVIDLGREAAPRLLTGGRIDHADPTWSPDGLHLAFSMNEAFAAERPEPRRALVEDIGLIPIEGGAVRRLTGSVGPAGTPAFSPEGATIAYVGHARQYGAYTNPSVWTVSAWGGEPRDVTAGFDRPFGDRSIGDLYGYGRTPPRPRWAPDGRSLYHLSSDRGMTHLVRVDVESGRVLPVTKGRLVTYHFSMSRDGRRAALCLADPVTPGDVFFLELGSHALERRLTEVNREFLSSVDLAVPEEFTFPSGDVTAEGWIMRPPGRDPSTHTPAVLEIHGGPMVMYGYRFFFEFQLLAANGLTVVYSNPRGSMGYGQAFTAAIKGDWGNKDFQDVMNAIDTAVERGGIDLARLGVAGGSYGGFMTNWIVGHTDRFKAAVAMRSISNEYSFFGTSDFGFTKLEEFGAPPWRRPGVYLAHSPISYVERVRTPLLMIQSEDDFRTPMEEAEQFLYRLEGPRARGRAVALPEREPRTEPFRPTLAQGAPAGVDRPLVRRPLEPILRTGLRSLLPTTIATASVRLEGRLSGGTVGGAGSPSCH